MQRFALSDGVLGLGPQRKNPAIAILDHGHMAGMIVRCHIKNEVHDNFIRTAGETVPAPPR
jgi:hypothetical protein